jgi:hypothetical protein
LGLIQIEHILPGTKVHTSSGYSECSELVYQGIQDVITIETEMGDFECTEKHKIAIMVGETEYKWKMAYELEEGDNLVFPVHTIAGLPQYINDSFAWMCGYLYSLDYNIVTLNQIEEIILKHKNTAMVPGVNSLKGIYTEYLSSKNTLIPYIILKSTVSIKQSFINGFASEHNIHPRSKLKQIQTLYSSMGHCYKPSGFKLVKVDTTDKSLVPVKFLGISRTGKKLETYDISVPQAKEFIAAQGFLVHNTAEIAFGNYNSEEFMDLKDYSKNPERMSYGWTSNNSIFAKLGMDYSEIAKRICINGEPGLAWLENMRKYSRMGDAPDNKDYRVVGGNPCLEQSLESAELCNLVENFPARADSLDDFLRTLKFAYLYAKTVTLCSTHWPETNRVMFRNRRIGCSVSGVAQFLSKNSLHTLNEWLDRGYNEIQKWDVVYSEWFCIPRSVKTTSIKPSGTVSLLAGATPGMHYPESRFYIRRMRLATNSPLVEPLKQAGYKLEPAVGSERDTMVVEIPVDVGKGIRTVNDVSIWEQVALAANMQRWWADNQVSCTVTFKPATEGSQIAAVLDYFQYQLKGISFLPKCEYGAFPQMPYEEITEEEYTRMCQEISVTNIFQDVKKHDGEGEKFCDGESCVRN